MSSERRTIPQELTDKSSCSEGSVEEPLPCSSQSIISITTKKRVMTDFITTKLVAVLDRCQLSIRDSVYILQAAVEALSLNFDDYTINKSSI